MIAFALTWLFIGSVVWMLCCDGLSAEVRLRRMAKGKRTRASHQMWATAWCIALWPVVAVRFVMRARMWAR